MRRVERKGKGSLTKRGFRYQRGGGGKEGAGDLILSWRGKSFLLFLFYFGCEEGKGEGRRGRLGERGEGGEVVVFEIGGRRKGE